MEKPDKNGHVQHVGLYSGDGFDIDDGREQRMRVLDLFCGAGGASMGYYRAFGPDTYILGVDNKPQPHYPFEFIQADALEFMRDGHGDGFDLYHASPPCQSFCRYKNARPELENNYPDLIAETRELLMATGKPYVIENVPGAPLRAYYVLCGSSFGLPIRRHRLFESSHFLLAPPCDHSWQKPQYPASSDRKPFSRRTMEIGSWDIPLETQQGGMGIDWMDVKELSQAIPPAYTEWIGRRIVEMIE